MNEKTTYSWDRSKMLEVELTDPENSFLQIKESLTRIGSTGKNNTLFQICHILHKRERYYITHFEEMYALDSAPSEITDMVIKQRDMVAKLLQDWGFLKVLKEDFEVDKSVLRTFKIVKFGEKKNWLLKPVYNMGTKKQ